jgi:hypothetical protein
MTNQAITEMAGGSTLRFSVFWKQEKEPQK